MTWRGTRGVLQGKQKIIATSSLPLRPLALRGETEEKLTGTCFSESVEPSGLGLEPEAAAMLAAQWRTEAFG